jgi:hypothetical protein
MMDDDPFLEIDFGEATKAQLSDTLLEGLFALTKGNFDPDTVSENARRSITHRAFYDYLNHQFQEPSIEFTRFLLKEVDIKHVRTVAVEGYRAIARAAFSDVFTANVLRRLDISATAPRPARDPAPEPAAETAARGEPDGSERGIRTTEHELQAFESIRRRLAFLAGGRRDLFDAIAKVAYRDYVGKMAVYYQQERKGRLADILEGRDGTVRFVLADGLDPTPVADLAGLDDRMKALFEKRVADVAP